jgi:hypothetical protein
VIKETCVTRGQKYFFLGGGGVQRGQAIFWKGWDNSSNIEGRDFSKNNISVVCSVEFSMQLKICEG